MVIQHAHRNAECDYEYDNDNNDEYLRSGHDLLKQPAKITIKMVFTVELFAQNLGFCAELPFRFCLLLNLYIIVSYKPWLFYGWCVPDNAKGFVLACCFPAHELTRYT